jgi:hypothetical protein
MGKANKRRRGFQHDYFTGEWTHTCASCSEALSAATRTMMGLIHKYHTKNECLGGW